MAKVIIFKRCEINSGEKERNEEFIRLVHEFAPYILEGEIDYVETTTNTKWGYANLFMENPDCELVFTAQNNNEAQAEACERGIMTFEWTCFAAKKFVPVETKREIKEGMTWYHKNQHRIQVNYV